MLRRNVIAAALVLGCCSLSTNGFAAETWPARPVRMVNPVTPGGGVDIVGRAIAQQLTELWGQPVIVDNRPGAGTTIGMEIVAHAPPDGGAWPRRGNHDPAVRRAWPEGR